jgi:hypothetical protein
MEAEATKKFSSNCDQSHVSSVYVINNNTKEVEMKKVGNISMPSVVFLLLGAIWANAVQFPQTCYQGD